MGQSAAERVADLLDDPTLSDEDRRHLLGTVLERRHDWRFWARPEQIEPAGDWMIWGYLGGRGSGKSRTMAEWMLDRSLAYWEAGEPHRGALINRTAADVRDVQVEGKSGILACAAARGWKAEHIASKRVVLLPDLKAELHTYTAEKPDQLRGPEHHTGWGDELGAWRHVVDDQGNTAWSNAMFGLRLDAPGLRPRMGVSTTPRRVPAVRDLYDQAEEGGPVVLSRATMYANIAHLSPSFVKFITDRYRNSPLAGQEIMGIMASSVPGALWDEDKIQRSRVQRNPDLASVIVGVDPPSEASGECGILVIGIEAGPADPQHRHVYVLEDASISGRAEEWAQQVIAVYHRHSAARVVAERNQGGDMVRAVIHLQDPKIIFEPVQAVANKWARAEPVTAIYDRVHHVGYFPLLEDQMCTWLPSDSWSPDRLDALVHAVRHLIPSLVSGPMQWLSPADMRLGGR